MAKWSVPVSRYLRKIALIASRSMGWAEKSALYLFIGEPSKIPRFYQGLNRKITKEILRLWELFRGQKS